MTTPLAPTDDTAARSVYRLLAAASVVFWDFDGVVKDSLTVKSKAFERLFWDYGNAVATRVREHHEAHTGVSRYDKVPLYLSWASEPADASRVREFCERFSLLVWQGVIDAAWVPGVREYLQTHHASQSFVLVTAAPQEEIQAILAATEISHCFREVHGAPTTKASAIKSAIQRLRCAPTQALMVGDSEADLAAAEANNVLFVLRCTPLNRKLQQIWPGPRFDGLTHE
jgi:phosphoglycolate phosphatase-like HAD superfamily hydrolase